MGNNHNELFGEREPEDDGIRISYRDYEPNKLNESFQTEIKRSKFKEWELQLTNAQDYPNNDESRLAIQTLKICIVESSIEDKIAQNGYALFDYVMLCYFMFRARLCADFPRRFVELYDTYVQNLLSLYCYQFFDIPQETTGRLIVSRANEYEHIVRQDNAIYHVTAALTQHIEKDFEGIPEYDGVLLGDILDNFELHIKLFDYIQATLNALHRHASALQAGTVKSNSQPTSEPLRVNHESAQRVFSQYEQTTRIQKAAKTKAQKRNTFSSFLIELKNVFCCPNCKTRIFNSQFCHKCGYQIKIKCDNCGKAIKRGALYCSKCGKQITQQKGGT